MWVHDGWSVDAGLGRARGRVMVEPRIPRIPGFALWPHEAESAKRRGKALRERVPRSAHGRPPAGTWRQPPADAVTGAVAASADVSTAVGAAVEAVEESNAGRIPELIPLRVGRMAASPFAFLRGSAGLMAADLADAPVTGIGAQICGDAHAANFGLYADARGRLVMDINDFDETVHGPWEWDVKRLATSLVLAGRQAGAA